LRKIAIIICSFVFCASASSLVYVRLLNEDDLDYQRIDNGKGVALGSKDSSEHPWGSYNEWQCFDVRNVEFTCADYDSGTLVPSLRFENEDQVFLFDTYVEDQLNCKETLKRWLALVGGGKEICIFAAHMPDVDLGLDDNRPQSLWYINRVKGAGGYWELYKESPAYNLAE
jgi:hypothetical protein